MKEIKKYDENKNNYLKNYFKGIAAAVVLAALAALFCIKQSGRYFPSMDCRSAKQSDERFFYHLYPFWVLAIFGAFWDFHHPFCQEADLSMAFVCGHFSGVSF